MNGIELNMHRERSCAIIIFVELYVYVKCGEGVRCNREKTRWRCVLSLYFTFSLGVCLVRRLTLDVGAPACKWSFNDGGLIFAQLYPENFDRCR